MAYEEFDGELDKPGEAPKGGYVEFDGELDKPAEGKKDEPKPEPRAKRGTMRQVAPFVARGGMAEAGGGRGFINPPEARHFGQVDDFGDERSAEASQAIELNGPQGGLTPGKVGTALKNKFGEGEGGAIRSVGQVVGATPEGTIGTLASLGGKVMQLTGKLVDAYGEAAAPGNQDVMDTIGVPRTQQPTPQQRERGTQPSPGEVADQYYQKRVVPTVSRLLEMGRDRIKRELDDPLTPQTTKARYRAGKEIEEFGKQMQAGYKEQGEKESPEMVAQAKSIESADGFAGTVKAMVDNPLGVAGIISQSAPDMLVGIGASRLATVVRMSEAAGLAAEARAAGQHAFESTLLKAGKSATTAGNARITAMRAREAVIKEHIDSAAERVAGGAGLITEALQSGASTRAQLQDFVAGMPDGDLLTNNARYRDLRKTKSEQEAKEILGDELGTQAAGLAAFWTAAAGKGSGAADAWGKTLSGQRIAGKQAIGGAAKEATEEGLQNPGEDFAAYEAQVQVDPKQKFDLGKSVAEGIVVGGAQGGALHGAGYLRSKVFLDEVKKIPKGPYRDAAEKGFVVDPPLVTDPPATQRAKTVKIFENVAAESGVSSAAIKRAKEAADGMPAADVGPFLNDVLQALQRKGGVATPISEHAAATLTAGAAAPLTPEEQLAAKEAMKPAAEQEEDLTGLADATPASALEEAANAEPEATSKDGFQTFDKETGSLGIPRAEMPQVKAEHRGAMVNFLNARGVAHQEETEVEATSLKPAQGEFSPEKVKMATEFTGGNRAILVSSDNYVLDGHHQWLAKMRQKDPVRIIRLDAPIKKLIQLVHDFPSSFAQNAANEPALVDVQPTPIAPTGAAAGRGDQPAGSSRAVGRDADDPARPGSRRDPATAPQPSVRAPGAVDNGSDKPAPVGRVISKVGVTPATASPLELRDNPDGTSTPWHDGYELVDFDSGDPLKIPAGTSDADALKIVKGARPFGKNSKYFAVASEEAPAAEPAPAPAQAPTPEPEKINTPTAEVATRDRNGLTDEDRNLRDRDAAASDLAGQMVQDVLSDDFSPGELPGALRLFAEAAKVPADDLRAEVLKRLRRGDFDITKKNLKRIEAALNPTAAPIPVAASAASEGEVPMPDTLAEALTALERGDRIVRFPGSEFEERVWLAESPAKGGASNSWVVKSKSADSPVTITKGPVGPDKKWGWGKSDAARKATEGWTFEGDQAKKVEEKPEVQAPFSANSAQNAAVGKPELTDEKAFADDYAAFEGKTVEQPVQVEETGETLKMRMDAATALREFDKRRKALEALKACLEKA